MIRLLELRSEKELSQRQIAKEFNVSQGTYNNWENENTQPSIEQLIQLALFFGVSVDYLIGFSDDFGTVSQGKLTNEELKLLKLFNKANKQTRDSIITILENTKQ